MAGGEVLNTRAVRVVILVRGTASTPVFVAVKYYDNIPKSIQVVKWT